MTKARARNSNLTTAPTTQFCAAKIEGPDGFLWVDGNGKITAGNGTLDNPKPNAFSLLHIDDCPGSTVTCRASCYVHGLEKHASDIYAFYRHNSTEMRRILADKIIANKWTEILGEWIRVNCQGGFRWHVSGDVFSSNYAQWIVDVCSWSADVNHWIYTRSFSFVPILAICQNLTVNLSCDKNNFKRARHITKDYNLRLCYLTDDGNVPNELPDGSVIFPDYALRSGTQRGREWFSSLTLDYKSFVCPVDYHGKSETRRCGPCNRCLG